ncbi:MAG: AAA family ATPase [Bacteroidales bacterium]|nr:AAA family ATPase [Bacteroidales bacterium]
MENKSVKELISTKESIDNVLNNHIRRKVFEIALSLQKQVLDETNNLSESIDYANFELYRLGRTNISIPIEKVSSILSQAIDQIEKAAMDKETTFGISSGYDDLDKFTQGWKSSDLIIIAGRPAMGKTTFALSMVKNISIDSNKTIAFFSLEMSKMQITHNLISIQTGIASNKLRDGDLRDIEWQQLKSKIKNLEDAPIYIDDTRAISMLELRSKCREFALKVNLNLIIIDFLQLLIPKIDNQREKEIEVDAIFRELKALAEELYVPIIVLSQLSKSLEKRPEDKRPRISDFHEAIAVKRYADKVLFLYRPEYYNINVDAEGKSLKGVTEVIIVKHPKGNTGTIKLNYNNKLGKFENVS